jgi:hypothetical protein
MITSRATPPYHSDTTLSAGPENREHFSPERDRIARVFEKGVGIADLGLAARIAKDA